MTKLNRFLALLTLALLPAGAFALPNAPAESGTFAVSDATLDSVTTSTSQPGYSNAGVLGYVLNFHDSNYEYALPICSGATLEEVTGATINPNSFVAGDTLSITASPSQPGNTECAQKVIRQAISRGPTEGQCLQDYQVTEAIDGNPKQVLSKTPYTYILTAYSRPTFDCDGQAYGSTAITNKVASGQSFVITLSQGSNQLNSWTITTDQTGKASLAYTFPQDGKYTFAIQPASDQTPGDVIYWTASVGASATSAAPVSTSKPNVRNSVPIDPLPYISFVCIALLAIAVAEFWHWRVRRRRSHELPVDEYLRTPKI